MTTIRICDLSMEQINNVFNDECFCLLRDEQLAALHERRQQLEELEASKAQALLRKRRRRVVQIGLFLCAVPLVPVFIAALPYVLAGAFVFGAWAVILSRLVFFLSLFRKTA